MNGLKKIGLASFLVLTASAAMAATPTPMDGNWICTTNAGTSSAETDKAADDKMAKTITSASDAFAFAASNCRDCTKITCEAQNPNQNTSSNAQ